MSVREFISESFCFSLLVLFFTSACSSVQKDDLAKSGMDTVVIQQMAFTPDVLELAKGDTVIFVNKDMVSHDVTGADKKIYSDTIHSGNSWIWAAVNDLDYYCSIHPTMKGKIVIKK